MKEVKIKTVKELNYYLTGRVISNIYVDITETKATLFVQVGDLTLTIKPSDLKEELALYLGIFVSG